MFEAEAGTASGIDLDRARDAERVRIIALGGSLLPPSGAAERRYRNHNSQRKSPTHYDLRAAGFS
jgi:hypothetical protein